MQGISKTQIIAGIGFLLLLISIPLSFSLVKQSQIFRSQASEKKTSSITTGSINKTATTPRPVPSSSPLSELQQLLQQTDTSDNTTNPTVSPTLTPDISLSFGPTLNFSVAIEGRPTNKQAGKVFIGIAANSSTPPHYILTFTVDVPDSGIFKGISLAGLNPGSSYTAFVKGASQIDLASTFTINPAETNLNNNQALTLVSGDLNEDNTINSADYTIVRNLYGATKAATNWNEGADFNKDGVINSYDLQYINKNMGKIGASGTWISSPRSSTPSASLITKPDVGGPATNFGDLLLSSTPSAEKESDLSPTSSYWLYIP